MMIDDEEPLMSGVKHALQREWQNIVHSDDVRTLLCTQKLWQRNSWSLFTMMFWIQAQEIPLGQVTRSNAKPIASRITKELVVEDPAQAGTRGFLRMRVEINMGKPLPMDFWQSTLGPILIQRPSKILL
ncbi:hypothetical protein PRUPE_5G009700 [Prunus persica]|uniref:DUF4283 domain-containing protein n=1 Tax=Prunus persica TaxID=3760 RepID=A0A251P553_PRUPE|nr:hypothetical protein PRUPE_5G009700 [Prunus persica]